MKTSFHTFPTPWGVNIDAYYREGTNDGGALISCMEQDEYKLERHDIGGGHTAIDIGGHIGSASLAMASRGCRVFAVEPVPENLSVFIKNVDSNDCGDLIAIYPRAITSHENRGNPVEIFYTSDETDHGFIHQFIASTTRQEERTDVYASGKSIMVPGVSIEEIFNDNGIDHCRFIKMDCEGGEWEAFRDLPLDLLKSVDIIHGEIHARKKGVSVSHNDLFPFMKGIFVDLSEIYEPIYSETSLEVCHFVYYNKRLV